MSIVHITGGHIILGASSGGTDTSDATAVAGDIRGGKTAYGSAGTKLTGTLNTYTPPMMQFDGSTGFYDSSFTSAGNKITVVVRFNRASFTGGGVQRLVRCDGATSDVRAMVLLSASDHADSDRAGTVMVQSQNASATNLCLLLSPTGYIDGEDHVLFYSFDGDNGTATFRIDGVDADDTGNADRVAPTTGSLETGASSQFIIGADNGPSNQYSGKAGFVGMAEAYLTNYEDFMDASLPKALDESGWTEWGAQPLFWNEYGFMENNKGSAGDMTKNGAIDIADFVAA